MPTLRDDLKHEQELLRRRFVHHTRPEGPLTMEQAIELSERMAGETNPYLEALRDILPLAEAFLRGAPSHPDNAKLETARDLCRER